MPELPEVQTMVSALQPTVSGHTITRTRLTHDDVLKNRSRQRFLRDVRHRTIQSVSRRAKNAVFDLGTHRLVIQPGMTGSFHTLPQDEAIDYEVLSLTLDDDRRLVYRDVRRLGRVYLFAPEEWITFSDRIGPEPLEDDLTPEAFHRILRRSRQAVKKVIMDQRRLAGVGNIYANEALFAAGIRPGKAARRVTREASRRLLEAIRRILDVAIRSEGTTIRNYRTVGGRPGNFQLQLMVYGRAGEPCRTCGGELVGTHAIDARSTVYCRRCQQ